MMVHHDNSDGILIFFIIPSHLLGNKVKLLVGDIAMSLEVRVLLQKYAVKSCYFKQMPGRKQ